MRFLLRDVENYLKISSSIRSRNFIIPSYRQDDILSYRQSSKLNLKSHQRLKFFNKFLGYFSRPWNISWVFSFCKNPKKRYILWQLINQSMGSCVPFIKRIKSSSTTSNLRSHSPLVMKCPPISSIKFITRSEYCQPAKKSSPLIINYPSPKKKPEKNSKWPPFFMILADSTNMIRKKYSRAKTIFMEQNDPTFSELRESKIHTFFSL